MKTYGNIYKCFIWTTVLFISGCSPVYRFNRLVERHPYLLESVKSDTVRVVNGQILDTFYVFLSLLVVGLLRMLFGK